MKTRDLTQLLRLAIDERKDFCVEETELYLEEAEKSYPQIKVVTEHIIAKYCSSSSLLYIILIYSMPVSGHITETILYLSPASEV